MQQKRKASGNGLGEPPGLALLDDSIYLGDDDDLDLAPDEPPGTPV